jgi:RNA polymerase sigma-70 factor (ECF subfamily)
MAKRTGECPPTTGHEADEELLARVIGGDRDALDRLYHRHAGAVFGYLVRLTDDHQLAEEVLQDTFLAVWNGAAFSGRSRVRTWLIGVASRQAGRHLRRRPPWLLLGRAVDRPCPEPSPEYLLEATELRRLLRDQLGQLTRKQREVLLLAFDQQLTHPEIAQVLGIRLGTVKSRLHGAKKALEQRWSTVEGIHEHDD